ncbi:hypothetical protein DAI22_04g153701 [Oryza sativa Japonica Group]|nr:hypothetical protein DAI22_04g153701 [Oryza sativa Japonica Group]
MSADGGDREPGGLINPSARRRQRQLLIDPVTVAARRRRGRGRDVRCPTCRSSGRAPAACWRTPGTRRSPRESDYRVHRRHSSRLVPPHAMHRGADVSAPHRSNAAAGDDDDVLLLLLMFAIATPAEHARPRSPCCAPALLETGLWPCGMERARGREKRNTRPSRRLASPPRQCGRRAPPPDATALASSRTADAVAKALGYASTGPRPKTGGGRRGPPGRGDERIGGATRGRPAGRAGGVGPESRAYRRDSAGGADDGWGRERLRGPHGEWEAACGMSTSGGHGESGAVRGTDGGERIAPMSRAEPRLRMNSAGFSGSACGSNQEE